MASNLISKRLASQAEFVVDHVQQTDYQHKDNIDVDSGIYDCDCNGFVAFVLGNVAPGHYEIVPVEANQTRPRAFEYYVFFSGLTPKSKGGWHRIDFLQDARRGDILAWKFPTVEEHHDTGHVVFVAETPTQNDAGVFVVRVYDSAPKPHFDDTRGDGPGEFPCGVGSGFINFQVDEAGRPTAFQFAPPASAPFTTLPIAIGRALKFFPGTIV